MPGWDRSRWGHPVPVTDHDTRRPRPGGVDLRVPTRELAIEALLVALLAGAGAVLWPTALTPLAVLCLALAVGVGVGAGLRAVGGAVAHPEGHLTVGSLSGTARYEMEDVLDVVAAPVSHDPGQGPPIPLGWGAELVLRSGVDVPLPCTRVPSLPALRRRLDRQVEDLRAWLEEGPA